jgi:hypothetical protein
MLSRMAIRIVNAVKGVTSGSEAADPNSAACGPGIDHGKPGGGERAGIA